MPSLLREYLLGEMFSVDATVGVLTINSSMWTFVFMHWAKAAMYIISQSSIDQSNVQCDKTGIIVHEYISISVLLIYISIVYSEPTGNETYTQAPNTHENAINALLIDQHQI